MVEKISVQIALEGGAEVQRQLEGIGDAGQKAFDQLAQSAEKVGGFKNLKTDEVTAQLKQLGLEGTKAFDQIQQAVSKAVTFEKIVVGVQSVETALKALSIAAVPVLGAIVAGFVAAAKSALNFAEAINKVDQEAINLGLTIEQFDKLRAGLENAGLSSKSISDGIAKLKEQLDKLDIANVKKAFDELSDAATRGFGAQGTAQLKLLQEAAQGIGPTADAARKALEKLGLPFPDQAATALEQLGIEAGSVAQRLPEVVEKLRQMPDSAQRSALAIQLFGKAAGSELVQALRTGGVAIDQFIQSQGQLTQQQANMAAGLEQSLNRLSAAWARFNTLSVAPQLTTGINLITQAINGLGSLLSSFNWGAFSFGAGAALNPIPTAIRLVTDAILDLGSKLTGISWDTISSGAQAAWGTVIGATQQAGEAISNFMSTLTGISWDTISSAATAAWNQVTTAVQGAGQAISEFVSSLGSITWDIISSAGVAAWNALTGAIQGAINRLLQFLGLQSQAGSGGAGAQRKASGGLIGGVGSGTSDSNLAWVSRGEHIMPAHVVARPGVLGLLEALRRGGGIPGYAAGGSVGDSGLIRQIANSLGHVIGRLKDIWDGLISGMQGVYPSFQKASDSIVEGIQKSDQVVRATVGSLQELQISVATILGNLINAVQGRAGGGLLGGRGSGTSDSNLAWVSRGEYIMPAWVVARPGMLAFLEALRSGLVPRFAGGGLVGSMSHVTIQFPGLPPIGGLRASSVVVDELQRAAALAQVRSGGRKPSRYS